MEDTHESNLDAILEHIQKPKKLTLPKGYVRKQNSYIDLLDIQDNLTLDSIADGKKHDVTMKLYKTNVEVEVKNVVEEKKPENQNEIGKKTRKPTAYNIFVKETVIKLQATHKELTPKERFKLAIKMWGESKQK